MGDRIGGARANGHSRAATLLFLRAALWTILFPGIVAGYIPWRFFGVSAVSVSGVSGIAGIALAGTGVFILLASIVEFARRGRGTLSPADPPSALVIAGPYRWVRNPMYSGVLFILAGEVLMGAEFGLLIYAAVFFPVVNLFIARFEEPYLEREFGSAYTEYKRHVRRWIPRVAPWRVPQDPALLTMTRSQDIG